MSRYLPRGALGAVVLVLACQTLAAPAPAHGQAAAEDANAAALKERDRLWEETQKLRAAGKTAEAIAAAEAMLAIERKVLREDDAELAVSLGWLAALQVEREDFAAATGGAARGAGHPAEAPGRVRLAGRRCPSGARRRRAPGRDGPGPARPPGRGGPAQPNGRGPVPSRQVRRSRACWRVRRWRSARRCWASATPTRHQPEQPGGAARGAGGLRRRQAPLRAGPGDPQGGAGRAPPRHRHQPEQPGGAARGAGGLRRRQAPLRAGPGDPQGGAGRAPPRHRHQPEQPGGAARGAGGLRRRQAPLRAGPGDPQGGAGRAPPRLRHQPEQPGGAARGAGGLRRRQAPLRAGPGDPQGGAGRAPPRLRHQPEQPGGAAPGAGGLRRRQAPLRAGPGDPQGGAGRAPPRLPPPA